ncbi:MAG: PD-(D/E)XK nuclease domain-containing protein, partial [Spirochaetota bacterium]|nr:PD-(D/E)XK nuclease domain-containing protein [Spirochaetota bacterium]
FASIPYNNYVKNNLAKYEGYYASVVFTFLASIGFDIIPEDITNKGRVDLTLKTPNSIIIMEFKVDSSEPPIKQIHERKYYEKYISDKKEIFLVGINFDSTEKQVGEFSWERL